MAPSLATLTKELVESVATWLSLEDLGHLRLTCRAMEQMASDGCFLSFFRHRRVELTTEGLAQLVAATKQVPQIRFLQECTLVGTIKTKPTVVLVYPDEPNASEPVYAPVEAVKEATKGLSDLLSEAFRRIGNPPPGSTGGLQTLRLKIGFGETVTQGLDHNKRCMLDRDTTASTFAVTMEALRRSPLRHLQHLDVFGGMPGYCSLDYNDVRDKMAALDHEAFECMKKVSMRISAPFWRGSHGLSHPGSRGPVGDTGPVATEQQRYGEEAIRQMVQLLGGWQVEALDLLWHNLGHRAVRLPPSGGLRVEQAGGTGRETMGASSGSSKSWKEIALRGFLLGRAFLLAFIEFTDVYRLSLEFIRLLDGIWAPRRAPGASNILDLLAGSKSPVQKFTLAELTQNSSLLRFNLRKYSVQRRRCVGVDRNGQRLVVHEAPFTSACPPGAFRCRSEDLNGIPAGELPVGCRPVSPVEGLGDQGYEDWVVVKLYHYGPWEDDGLMEGVVPLIPPIYTYWIY